MLKHLPSVHETPYKENKKEKKKKINIPAVYGDSLVIFCSSGSNI